MDREQDAAALFGTDAEPDLTPLYALLEGRTIALGELLDFADAIPEQCIIAVALALGAAVYRDYRRDRQGPYLRRRLVIFGRLIERVIFETEAIPKRRDHRF